MPNITINISAPGTARQLSTSTPMSVVAHADPLALVLPAAGSEPVALDSGTDQLMTASALASRSDPRSEKWAALLAKHGREKLDAHEWEWRNGDWLPWYRYQPVDAITDVWTEYVDGLNGCLSTRELKDRWGAKWRRNEGGLKTEAARRAKVITLIERLAMKPNWNTPLALRFLVEKYENGPAFAGKVRAFCDYLQKDGGAGFQSVLAAATHYP
jgi:hypothetical protein